MSLNQNVASVSLHIGSPEQTDMNIGQSGFKPFNGLSMQVSIDEIDFFEKNPRHSHDPEMYAQIKESIRASGVQQPVHITKRPNANKYVLAQGGNTRLKIVKELYEETGESRFSQMPCIYTEYTNDENILIAHLIENEQRADMSFWDKVSAYAELRDLFQQQSGKELSARALEPVFKEHGISLSYSKLAMYFFAANSLFGLGTFCNSLSLQKSNSLRQQFNDLKQTAKSVDSDNEALFDMFWEESMFAWSAAQTEDAELDIASIQTFVAKRFASTFQIAPTDNDEDATDATALPLHQKSENESSVEPVSRPAATDRSEIAANSDDQKTPATVKPVRPTPEHQSDSADRRPVAPADGPIIQESNESDGTAPVFAVDRTRSDIQQDLLLAVKRLLKTVNLEKYLLTDSYMPYGFLLELPSLNKEPLASRYEDHTDEVLRYGAIYLLHPSAGYVYHKLWEISWQKILFNPNSGFDLPGGHNPFDLPGTQLAMCYRNIHATNQVMQDILKMELYEQNSHREFFDFLIKNHEACSAFTDFLGYCAELESKGGDNVEYIEDNPVAIG